MQKYSLRLNQYLFMHGWVTKFYRGKSVEAVLAQLEFTNNKICGDKFIRCL